MRKSFFILICLLLALPLCAEQSYTVVLDAGHGGKDPGAVGKHALEKNLNLSLALQVGKLLNEQYPDVKVVYTRSTDVFIPLQTRADIANKNNADLFISIHTNSSESKVPCGVETFILGTDKMEKNLDVAMRENAVMKLEADYKTTYQGFDPNSIDSYIMFELMQNAYLDQSLQFATHVQQNFVGRLNRDDRGVRQAAFWVLLKTACPSILFEMGFVSNPDEEKFLSKKENMVEMAQALVDAFGAYTHKQRVKASTLSTPVLEPVAAEQPKDTVKAEQPSAEKRPAELPKDTKKAEPKTLYAVQICASKTPLKENDPRFKGLKCDCMQVGEWYKYYTAVDADRERVVEDQKELKSLFPDCWVIRIEN